MTFEEQLQITVIDKALFGVALLVVGWWINRALERTRLGLKSQIEFKEKQLSDFYGPIAALVRQIRPLDDLWNAGNLGPAEHAIVAAIRAANNRIVETILSKSHLVEGTRLPEYIPRFLTHVAVWHAWLDNPRSDWSVYKRLPGVPYEMEFEDEILRTTEALKNDLMKVHAKNRMVLNRSSVQD